MQTRKSFQAALLRQAGVDRDQIIVGGRTPAAFRRAVQDSHGWYGFGLDVEQTARDIKALREMEQRLTLR